MAKAAGFEVSNNGEDDDMGSIVITGDINATDPAAVIRSLQGDQPNEATKPTPANPPARSVTSPSLAKLLAAGGLAALGMGAGISLPIAAYNMGRAATEVVTPSPVEDTDTNTRYRLRIYKGEGQQETESN